MYHINQTTISVINSTVIDYIFKIVIVFVTYHWCLHFISRQAKTSLSSFLDGRKLSEDYRWTVMCIVCVHNVLWSHQLVQFVCVHFLCACVMCMSCACHVTTALSCDHYFLLQCTVSSPTHWTTWWLLWVFTVVPLCQDCCVWETVPVPKLPLFLQQGMTQQTEYNKSFYSESTAHSNIL